MSTSKGRGAAAHTIGSVVPPEQLRFLFVRHRPESAIEFDPEGTDAVPRLFDEFDRLGAATAGREVKGELPSGHEAIFRYSLLDPEADVRAVADAFRPAFAHLALLVQVPGIDVAARVAAEKGSPLTETETAQLETRLAAVRGWLDAYAPDRARIEIRRDALPARRSPAADHGGSRRARGRGVGRGAGAGDGWQRRSSASPPRRGSTRRGLQRPLPRVPGPAHGPRAGWLLASLDPGFVVSRCARRASRLRVLIRGSARTGPDRPILFGRRRRAGQRTSNPMSVGSTAPRGARSDPPGATTRARTRPWWTAPSRWTRRAAAPVRVRHPQGRGNSASKASARRSRRRRPDGPEVAGCVPPSTGRGAHRRDRRGARRAEAELEPPPAHPNPADPRSRRGEGANVTVRTWGSREPRGVAADGSAWARRPMGDRRGAGHHRQPPRRQDRRLRLPGLQAAGSGCSARHLLVHRRATRSRLHRVWPPAVVNTASARGTGRSRTRRPMYVVTVTSVLVPTAEVRSQPPPRRDPRSVRPADPLAAYTLLRREAGPRQGHRGILRVHQFDRWDGAVRAARGQLRALEWMDAARRGPPPAWGCVGCCDDSARWASSSA